MAKKPADKQPTQVDLEEVLNGLRPAAIPDPEGASRPHPQPLDDADGAAPTSPQEQGAAPEAPLTPPEAQYDPPVVLPKELFEEPAVHASFSDDPPEGWGSGQGNVLVEDPVTSQLDPVSEARRSLLEDAARAAGSKPAPLATVAQPVQGRGSRVPEIRQALARAATHPNYTRYRSRVTVGAAYQYDGKLHQAPDYIDRNWAAWDDGPAINIPEVGIVKAGQWIVIQKVLDDAGGVGFEELKIYDDAVFRSLFMVEGQPTPGAAAPNA